MLEITIPETQLWDERISEFVTVHETTLKLEHSLLSVSKWEMEYEKPFLKRGEKTAQEFVDYIKCMTINTVKDPYVYLCLTSDNIKEINQYIERRMTSLYFYNDSKESGSETVTSELIYYWMFSLGIPIECEKWHLSRLIALIRLCNDRNNPDKNKMSKTDVARKNAELNAQRKAKLKHMR